MEDSITLRRSEQRRVHVLLQLAAGVVSAGQAAELLSLSERQVRRLAAAMASDGPAGLLHGNRGRRPSNAVSEVITARVIELATTTYRGFNQRSALPGAPADARPGADSRRAYHELPPAVPKALTTPSWKPPHPWRTWSGQNL